MTSIAQARAEAAPDGLTSPAEELRREQGREQREPRAERRYEFRRSDGWAVSPQFTTVEEAAAWMARQRSSDHDRCLLWAVERDSVRPLTNAELLAYLRAWDAVDAAEGRAA